MSCCLHSQAASPRPPAPLGCLAGHGNFKAQWRLPRGCANSVHLLLKPLRSHFRPVPFGFQLLGRCCLQVDGKAKETACFPAAIYSSQSRHAEQQPCPQTRRKATSSTISVLFPSEKPLYLVNLLAIGCFTLRSIMFPEKDELWKCLLD